MGIDYNLGCKICKKQVWFAKNNTFLTSEDRMNDISEFWDTHVDCENEGHTVGSHLVLFSDYENPLVEAPDGGNSNV